MIYGVYSYKKKLKKRDYIKTVLLSFLVVGLMYLFVNRIMAAFDYEWDYMHSIPVQEQQ